MVGNGNYIGVGNGKAKKLSSYKLLQDYTFDKSNSDVDRDKVYNKLNPNEYIQLNNFAFNLHSGYGLYHENYLTYMKAENVFVTDDHSVTIMNFVQAGQYKFVLSRYAVDGLNATKVKITGLTATNQLVYEYVDVNRLVEMSIPKDGEYYLPASIKLSEPNEIGFIVKNSLTKDVTIEQIPEYPNHLVFDGVDDITSPIPNLNAKEGTIIFQMKPIDNINIKFSPIQEGTFQSWAYGAYLQRNLEFTARNLEEASIKYIRTDIEGGIYSFAYNSNGITLLYDIARIIITTNINKHAKYIFGCNSLTNFTNVSKLALKRVKIFNKKLTLNQLIKEYNNLLNE